MKITHACHRCMGSYGRRALSRLLQSAPNTSTAGAVERLGLSYPWVKKMRREMQGAGCVPPRTVDGRTHRHLERAAKYAPVSAAHLQPVVLPPARRPSPIGSLWLA